MSVAYRVNNEQLAIIIYMYMMFCLLDDEIKPMAGNM